MRLMQKCGECTSQIHLYGQVCPCRAAELVRHFIGFTVTLGGFKVDSEGEKNEEKTQNSVFVF